MCMCKYTDFVYFKYTVENRYFRFLPRSVRGRDIGVAYTDPGRDGGGNGVFWIRPRRLPTPLWFDSTNIASRKFSGTGQAACIIIIILRAHDDSNNGNNNNNYRVIK